MHWHCDDVGEDGMSVRVSMCDPSDGRLYDEWVRTFVPHYAVFHVQSDGKRCLKTLKKLLPSSMRSVKWKLLDGMWHTHAHTVLDEDVTGNEGKLLLVYGFRRWVYTFLEDNFRALPPYNTFAGKTGTTKTMVWLWMMYDGVDAIKSVWKVSCDMKLASPSRLSDAKVRVCSFDIECIDATGKPYSGIPVGSNPRHECVMISCVIAECSVFSNEQLVVKDTVLFRRPHPSFPTDACGVGHVMYETEAQLLDGFLTLLLQEKVCYLVGYNVTQFDIPFLIARLYHVLPAYFYAGDKFFYNRCSRRSLMRGGQLTDAYQHMVFERKIQVIDYYLYVDLHSGYDLPNKKLDTVARAKIGKGKAEVDVMTIQDIYCHEGEVVDEKCWTTLEDVDAFSETFGRRVGATFHQCLEYCRLDSQLVLECCAEDMVLQTFTEFAVLTGENVSDLLSCYVSNSAMYKSLFGYTGVTRAHILLAPRIYAEQSERLRRTDSGDLLDLTYKYADGKIATFQV